MIKWLSKSAVLHQLVGETAHSTIPPFWTFRYCDFKFKSRHKIIARIRRDLKVGNLILRSSCSSEDQLHLSNAGKFLSLTIKVGESEERIVRKVKSIFESYCLSEDELDNEEIIVQQLVKSVAMSGVIFTATPESGLPYTVINYDDVSGRTDTITSGMALADHSKLFTLYSDRSVDIKSPRIRALMEASDEIKRLTDLDALDIEFALDYQNCVHLLQVRPLVVAKPAQFSVTEFDGFLGSVVAHYREVSRESGSEVPRLFSVMSDWNPAEMIGLKPSRFSRSLYERLITNGSWLEARAHMGYDATCGESLMRSFGGIPYVDVMKSMSSLIPNSIPPKLRNRLLNAYLERLYNEPHLHDKIEFEICITSYHFSIERSLSGYEDHFDREELSDISNQLRSFTVQLAQNFCAIERKRLECQIEEFDSYISQKSDSGMESLTEILETTKRLGIVPFAQFARYAFIGRQLLQSLVDINEISDDESQLYLKGLHTVSKDISLDIRRVRAGELSTDFFQDAYGHLRPHSYDICAPSYRDIGQELFKASPPVDSSAGGFEEGGIRDSSRARVVRAFANQLSKHQIYTISGEMLEDFVRNAIECREWAKFVFSKGLDRVIRIVRTEYLSMGLSDNELRHLDINDILASIGETTNARLSALGASVKEAAREYEMTLALRLPDLIREESDFYAFGMQAALPTFVTNLCSSGELFELNQFSQDDLSEKIVLIENADPGFDWIFSFRIGGLVTKYGGANSHMAIRCSELGVPAAIGIGSIRYDNLKKSRIVVMDCARHIITGI